jgi:very-short-patch-repair endonuclease
MINLDFGSKGRIGIVDERSADLLELLVSDKKTMSFIPAPEKTEELPLEIPQEELEAGYKDNKLKTTLDSKTMETRLLQLFRSAKSAIEEQGSNILFIALGKLVYQEAEYSKVNRSAPLVMIPVKLERKDGRFNFVVSWTGEEIRGNVSIHKKVKEERGLTLPIYNQNESLEDFFESYKKAISPEPTWFIKEDDISLCLLTFKTLMLWEDLDINSWLDKNGNLPDIFNSLLVNGFQSEEGELDLPSDFEIDKDIPVEKLDHVVNADSYQTKAIESVRRGNSLVIQGPPGTGKSQTIVNLLSTAVLDGKKVLFIAQKKSALDVVHARLKKEGLDDLCLDLHGTKGVRGEVLAEIKRTWELGSPIEESKNLLKDLEEKREALNNYAKELNKKVSPYNLSLYDVIGHLCLLRKKSSKVLQTGSPMDSWTLKNLSDNTSLLKKLLENYESIGSRHIDWGWQIQRSSPLGADRLLLSSLLDEATQFLKVTKDLLVKDTGLTPAKDNDWDEIFYIEEVLGVLETNREAISKSLLPSLFANSENIEALVNLQESLSQKKETFPKELLDQDEAKIKSLLDIINLHKASFWRFFNGSYKQAIKEIKAIISYNSLDELTKNLGAFIDYKNSLNLYNKNEKLLLEKYPNTSINEIFSQLELAKGIVSQLGEGSLKSLTQISQDSDLENHLKSLTLNANKARAKLEEISSLLFLETPIFSKSIPETLDFVNSLSNNIDIIDTKCFYNSDWQVCNERGLSKLLEEILEKQIPSSELENCLALSYYALLYRIITKDCPILSRFEGRAHSQVIEEFRKLDKERLHYAKIKTLEAHQKSLPPRQGGVGLTGMLLEEMEIKRNGRSLRRIIQDGAQAIQRIKPIFMMSPASMAQYLPKGSIEFDLLIIDEASQIKPMEVLGAFGRCKQYVVVGDSKQLPPTSFFDKLIEDSLDEEESPLEIRQAKEMESILSLAYTRGLKERYLNWHYRSRHHSLISLSNREFYDNRLWVIPSPHRTHNDIGLKFYKVEDGVYDRGKSTMNKIEAQRVVDRLKELMRSGETRSILVATLSTSQKEAIENIVEIESQNDPTFSNFLRNNTQEPFDIKNLESVQGDERDIVLISIGYGKDSNNRLTMDFGPVSKEGGERRLNVLMTRARELCEVYSSISASDIVLSRGKGKGTEILKEFLYYAEHGNLPDFSREKGYTMSPFEESVKLALEDQGYTVHTQVGETGFFIDLAIVNPQNKGEYLLGIECDGATYHSSGSARDRDRLRQQVLEDKGWTLHRIWSTDWFVREGHELKEILNRLNTKKESIRKIESISPKIERTSEIPTDSFSTPYIKFENRAELKGSELIENIIRIEGPIHKDEIAKRYSSSLGLAKTGSKIKTEVNSLILKMIYAGTLDSEGENMDWVWVRDQAIAIRNRSEVEYNLRRPEFLPPCEIREAIKVCVKECHGATKEELERSIPKQLGISSSSQKLREIVSREVDELVSNENVKIEGGLLKNNM